MYHNDDKALIEEFEQRIEDLRRENRALTFDNAHLKDLGKMPVGFFISSKEALMAIDFLEKEQKLHLWLTRGEKRRSKNKADDYFFIINLLKRFTKVQNKLSF